MGGPINELAPAAQREAMAQMFPGLYQDVTAEQQKARQVVQVPTGVNGSVPWASWPVPCPECRDYGVGMVTDPVSTQVHHYTCPFWDRTGRQPF